MKKFFSLIMICLPALFVQAQRTADIGLSGGVVNYVGDLGNEKYFPFSSANTGAAITIRNFINNPSKSRSLYPAVDVQLRFSWHRLQYDEIAPIGSKQGMELRNYLRGISFRNDLFGSEIDITYNFYPNRFAPLNKPRFSFFVSAGIGIFHGTPKADLFSGDPDPSTRYHFWSDGTIRDMAENDKGIGSVIEKDGSYETNLRDWMTEGQGYNREVHRERPYSETNIGIPFGGGIRYMYNKFLTLTAEFNYYYFMTDYLDDVSGRYATHEELKASFPDPIQFELARYISDPTGRGTNGFIGPATSPRGNPELKDAFTYISLEASYKITWKKKGIYGQ